MNDLNVPQVQRSNSSSTLAGLFPKGPSSFRNSLVSTRKSSVGEIPQPPKQNKKSGGSLLQKKLSLNLKDVETQILETGKSPTMKKEGSFTVRLKRSPSASGTLTSVRQSSGSRKPLDIFTLSPTMFMSGDPSTDEVLTESYRHPLTARTKKVTSFSGMTLDLGLKTSRADSKRGVTIDLKTQATPRNKLTERTPKTVTFDDVRASLRSVERASKKKIEAETPTSTAAVKPKVRSEKDKKKRILSIIKVPTKYPDLEAKIKEFLIDSSFTENFGQEPSPSKELPKHKKDFEISYDEKVTTNHNLNKSGMVWDVRSKEVFNKWFDEVIIKTYLERVDKLSEYLSLGAADDSPVKELQPQNLPSDPDAKANIVQEKAASLLQGFEYIFKDQGGTKHMCYHPKSFPEAFNRFIANARELRDETRASANEPNEPASKLLGVIQKAMQEKTKLLAHQNRSSSMDKKEGRKGPPVPDMLVALDRIKNSLADKYLPMYSRCDWNQKFEKDYQEARLDNVVSTTRCTFDALNKSSMLNFLRRSPKIKQQQDRIEQEEMNKKYQNFPLHRNFINVTKLQNGINNMDKKLLEDIEYKVANEILCKFENDIEYIYKGRTKYLKRQNNKKVREINEIDERKSKEIVLEEQRKSQKIWSERVRLMLKLNEEGTYTKSSKEMTEIPMLKDLNRTFSMIPRAKDIVLPVDRTAVLRCRPLANKGSLSPTRSDGVPAFTEDERPRTCRLSSVGAEIKDKPKLRSKLKRVYSGGPRAAPGRVITGSMEKLQKAVLKLQSYTRGIVARKKFLDKQEKNEMIKTTKKSLRFSIVE